MPFENLKKSILLCKKDPGFINTKEGAVSLFCADCDFFKESDWDLECGAFKLMRRLVERGVLTPENIADAIRD